MPSASVTMTVVVSPLVRASERTANLMSRKKVVASIFHLLLQSCSVQTPQPKAFDRNLPDREADCRPLGNCGYFRARDSLGISTIRRESASARSTGGWYLIPLPDS